MKLLVFFSLISFSIFSIAQAQEADDLDEAIRKHRTGVIVIKTEPNTTVNVAQLRHEFWFGAAIADGIFNGSAGEEDVKMYKEKFLENFNSAVTENAVKWGNMEREQGIVNFATTDNILTWTDEHHIPLRGHNIFWGIPNRVQDWLKEMDDAQLYEALQTRARTVAARYKGRFVEYDLNNEMIHGNYYEDRLGPGITGEMVQWVKATDPQAKLFLNDYDILTARLVREYAAHIQGFLDQGVQIDGIGVQGHLHSTSFNADSLKFSLDVLSQFNLPIRITEFNMPGQRSEYVRRRSQPPPEMTPEEEQQRARNLTDYYRICFAHPAVEGILMWGFWEGANWIPASSLYRKDWTTTPAAEAYWSLIYDEWWTKTAAQSGKDGMCVIPAFYGTHKVTVNGVEKTVKLSAANGSTYIDMRTP